MTDHMIQVGHRPDLIVVAPGFCTATCAQDLEGVASAGGELSLHHCPVCGDVRVSTIYAGTVLRARSNHLNAKPVDAVGYGRNGHDDRDDPRLRAAVRRIGIHEARTASRPKGKPLVTDRLYDWYGTRNIRACSSHFGRASSIGQLFSPSCCFPSSWLPIMLARRRTRCGERIR